MNLRHYISSLFFILITIIVHGQITVIKDIDYVTDAVYEDDKDLLDIYMPEGKKDVPVIVFVHGGALLSGDKSWSEGVGQKVAAAGIGVVCVNYRLSPQFQHPTHLNDVATATQWVIDNIAAYGGDPQRVFIGGHSAGAYLAALIAIDDTILPSDGAIDAKLSGAILISPFLYVEETARDRIAIDPIYKSIWGDAPADWKQASVTPHLSAERDNILLIYAAGDDDWRKAQIQRFTKRMIDGGNQRIVANEVPDRDHMTIISDLPNDDDRVVKLIVDFVMNQ